MSSLPTNSMVVDKPLTEEEFNLPCGKFEYLDHTADVQLHAWGDSLKEAFEQCGIAMFGYMTDLTTVEIEQSSEIEARGHDLESLLFHFLDELLFLFSCEPYLICSKLSITQFETEGEEMIIKCNCYGEEFTIGKHPQGTEVKAITYSAMQIINEPDKNNYEGYMDSKLQRNHITFTVHDPKNKQVVYCIDSYNNLKFRQSLEKYKTSIGGDS